MPTRLPLRWYAWSAVTDAYVACGGYGTRLYYWLLQRCAELDPWFSTGTGDESETS